MFDQSFVDGAAKTNKSWTVTLSCIVELIAIGMTVLVPLIWTEVLPRTRFVDSMMAPASAPPPPPAVRATTTRPARSAPRLFTPALEAPHEIRRQVEMVTEDPTLPAASLGESQSGVPGGASPVSIVFAGPSVQMLQPSAPPVSNSDATPKRQTPLPVGGNVQSAKLLKHPAPAYPGIAKSARIQGTVVLQAVIGKDGTVRDLRVVSTASPLLVGAAMDAVKQWLYQPTLLNREPVEVVTEITITFALQ